MHTDVLIVGGGPAGLNAALVLGRARKRVVLCDAGPPRNAAAGEMHNFVTRDGITPAAFRAEAHREITAYGVERREARVTAIARDGDRFRATLDDGELTADRVVLAVGMVDEHPDWPGYRELFGSSIHLCPYCHGWELRDQPIGLIAASPQIVEWSLLLTGWSRDLIVIADPRVEVPAELAARLAAASVRLVVGTPRALIAEAGRLAAVELTSGERIARTGLFVKPPQRQTDLVSSLGLALDDFGFVRTENYVTSVPGIYAAGDLATGMQGAVIAAAAGMAAAAHLNHALTITRALDARARV
jgi:thioredoxin reductase